MNTYGQITSIDSGVAQVRLAGDSHDTAVSRSLASYEAAAGDMVLLTRCGPQWIILGKLGPVEAA